jgi:hypothetical protein
VYYNNNDDGTHQLLVYADNNSLLGKNIYAIHKKKLWWIQITWE